MASAQVFSIHGDFKHFCILRVYYYLTLKYTKSNFHKFMS